MSWITSHSANARRIVPTCSGAFILAACGLLDKRRAVTHGSVSNKLAKLYPQIKVESDPIFIQDGPIWTSAGVTAGIDLALSLVQQDLDHKTALNIAKKSRKFYEKFRRTQSNSAI
ncbi:DJ-1/PfpI family protein [Pseudomonas synxantha]|nr:DJ-1/PfpI family protein [Pseudomonas synxantha]